MPQINGKAGFTDNFALPTQLLPGEAFGQEGQIPVKFGVRYGVNAGVEANQMLFNMELFQSLRKLDAAKSTYKLQTLATVEDLVYQVIQVYIQHQITQEQEDILNSNLTRVDQLVTIAQAQFENGIIKKLDVDQLRVNRTNLSSELSNLKIGAEQQLNLLRFYLALDMDKPMVLSEKLNGTDRYPLSPELMLSENINFQLLQHQKTLNYLEGRTIKAGFYPKLSAVAQYNYTGQMDEFGFKSPNYSSFGAGLWGLSVSIPIFDGLQKVRKIQENKLKMKQLEYQEEYLEKSSKMEFQNARVKIDLNNELVTTQEANMELAQGLYDVTKQSYQEGVAPLTELLNAETSLKEAQSPYLTALLNFKLAELEHVKVSGQLAKLIQSTND